METQSQDFRLTWVNYSQKLTESFHKFLTSEILCNVTLWVHNGTSSTGDGIGGGPTGSNSIKAHQAILSACSPWFEEVLSQSQHPHPVIILKDVRYQDLKNIIRFIYTGEVFVPQHELKDFLRTAELLEIKGLLKDADDPAWSGLSSLFQPSPIGQSPLIQQNQQQAATVTNQQLLAAAQVASAATSPTSILAGNLAAAAAAAQQQNIVNLVNTVPTVPVSSLLLPNAISDGTTSINDLVSQIKVPVSLTSCQKLISAAANASVSTASGSNAIGGGGLISTGLMDASTAGGSNSSSGTTLGSLTSSSITTAVQQPIGRRRKAKNQSQLSTGTTALSNIVMDQQTIRDGISGQQIILQQPSSGTGINSNQHPTIVTTSGNYLSSSLAKRQRLNLGNQASELVETHHLVVAGDNEPGGSLLSHGDDDAVSWIEEVASTGSTTNALTNTGNASTSGGTNDTPNNTTTLSPAEWVATGISDCGAFKRLWAERYLCYNLGREIICLLCFCRFTQFKKFNLERHMKNKHPQMLSLNEATRKQILERYVARYINHVTTQKDASSGGSTSNNNLVGNSGSASALHPSVFTNSVGGGHSVMGGQNAQHDVASEILSIGPIQLDDLSQTDLVTPITITASTSATGQQIITTPISTASGRISNAKSISSTNNTTSSLTSSSIRDLTSNRSSTGGSTATSMHLQTSKQEPLTSIVVIKTESGSISSGNLIGVSDEDDCNTDNDIDLGTNSNLDKHSESNGGDPNVITTCDNNDLVDGESHSIVVQRSSGNVVTSTEIVGQQPPEDLMQNVECELEEPEGEILLVK